MLLKWSQDHIYDFQGTRREIARRVTRWWWTAGSHLKTHKYHTCTHTEPHTLYSYIERYTKGRFLIPVQVATKGVERENVLCVWVVRSRGCIMGRVAIRVCVCNIINHRCVLRAECLGCAKIHLGCCIPSRAAFCALLWTVFGTYILCLGLGDGICWQLYVVPAFSIILYAPHLLCIKNLGRFYELGLYT